MNEELAKRKVNDLRSKTISGWEICDYLGAGKSAFVCKAIKAGKMAAIKLFDTSSLIKKEIDELKIRLDRQLLLKNKKHPNLVEIYDAGYDDASKYFFLIMQFIDATPLSKTIGLLPQDKIGPLISQIASAAQFLDTLDLFHRDIKPDNIVVTDDYSKAVLLDLGVLLPLGKSELTDSTHTIRFVGTLRYSSPEFLFRKEEDTKEGWRAVSFYQIGAVLHDMIMRTPIFEGQTEPFAKLVHAIEYESPFVFREDVDPELIHVARLCLLKQPSLRLKMINWDSFSFPRSTTDKIIAVKTRIQQRKITCQNSNVNEINIVEINRRDRDQFLYDLNQKIEVSIRNFCIGNEDFPRVSISTSTSTGQFDSYVNVTFASSLKHSLCCDLAIIITCSIVDFNSRLIQFQCVGNLQPTLALEDSKSYLSLLYEGFIDDKLLQDALRNMLCTMLDSAQLRCDSTKSTSQQNFSVISPWIIYKFDDKEEENG